MDDTVRRMSEPSLKSEGRFGLVVYRKAQNRLATGNPKDGNVCRGTDTTLLAMRPDAQNGRRSEIENRGPTQSTRLNAFFDCLAIEGAGPKPRLAYQNS